MESKTTENKQNEWLGQWRGNTDAVVVPPSILRELLEYFRCELKKQDDGTIRYISTKQGYEKLEIAYFSELK